MAKALNILELFVFIVTLALIVYSESVSSSGDSNAKPVFLSLMGIILFFLILFIKARLTKTIFFKKIRKEKSSDYYDALIILYILIVFAAGFASFMIYVNFLW